MDNKRKTGIYFIKPPIDLPNNEISISQVISYAEKFSQVIAIWKSNETKIDDPEKFAEIIKKLEIKRIVIAGNTPGMVKSFFARVMKIAGNKPADILLASFREHNAVRNADTDLAKIILSCAVNNVPFKKAAKPEKLEVNPNTLVIGGGIAGVQASLEIADAGQKVFLVERSATIGGYMATFDKTFPTLDCAACILTPKMGEVGAHQNIDMMTYSEVQGISGIPGNYEVKILKKARCVSMETCIGCGSCTAKCPSKIPSEFDSDTTLRKAIYIPFPQAVPNKYLVDKNNCSYIKEPFFINKATYASLRKSGFPNELVEKLEVLKGKSPKSDKEFDELLESVLGKEDAAKHRDTVYQYTGKCKNCIRFCPVIDCINLDEQDQEIEITVGNIILATGYKPFDAERDERYGYKKYPNVLTSLEFERLVNASGSTGGNIYQRTQDKKGNWIFQPDGKSPESIAIIHCIGSRDENYNKYCSKVCCMYSLKLAHLVVEKLPNAKVYEYYIDIRAFGKGYEEFYKRIDEEGVNIIRGRTAQVEERDGKLWIRSEDIIGGKITEQFVDMIVLAVGLEPREDADNVAEMAGIKQDKYGWFKEANYISEPIGTFTGGVSVAGVCQGPKDIPDTVAQASAAASRVLQSIMSGKISDSVNSISLTDMEFNILKTLKEMI